ncbi:hypothetical protein ACFVAD_08070 [Sutcliffiella sp. NPDC057660]|uniref:hypothetical protein n=1 Tax=Sutcliffiella sp. NPDC057660 TaxID=3346199 RepID=UPI003694ECFA
MKKLLILSLSLAFTLVLLGFSSGDAQAKETDEFTLNEIQQILQDYFSENDLELEVGSQDYVEYLLLQLLDKHDEKLSKHPQYDMIHYYMGEYLYLLDQHQGEGGYMGNDSWRFKE